MRELILSLPEKKFILKAASESKRLDGRKPEEFRPCRINFGREWGSCLVTLGETKVLANVSCEVQEPRATRPNDGLLFVNVEISGMAAPHLEGGTRSELGVHLSRMLEKCLKECKAVDLEGLCLVADEKVWALRLDVNVINHEGNLVDCAALAGLAALAHFRRPDATLDGTQLTVHDPSERDPIPITLHHHPVCVSFAYMEPCEKIFSDPTAIEERVADACLVFGINAFREICALHLGGTCVLPPKHILRCANRAALQAKQMVDLLKASLAEDLHDRLGNRPTGFAPCCESGKITSLSLDTVKIQLGKFRLSQPLEIPDDVSMEDVSKKTAEDVDIKVVEEECQVVDLGDKTAELISMPKKRKGNIESISIDETKYGEGGPSQWIVETDTVPIVSIDDPDITVVPLPQRKAMAQCIELDGDSDEEVVHVLDSKDLAAAECVKTPNQQRQNKLKKEKFKSRGKKNR